MNPPLLMFVILTTLNASAAAAAQSDYPSRPIRFVVGFPPGGGADTATRSIAGKLGQLLGQQIIIDNRPGASGNIGTEIVARSTPDGYTLLMGSVAALAINPSLFSKLAFHPLKDLAPVSRTVDSTNILCLNATLEVANVREFIALGRSKPLNAGSSGVGSTGHLAGEMLNTMVGTRIVHVPYKGGGPAMVDLMAGNIHMIFANAASAVGPLKSGKIKAIAVTTAKRSRLMPELPTMIEGGVPGYEANNWLGVVVPAGTPRAVVERLNKDVVATLNTPEVADQLFRQGFEVAPSTPQEFAHYIKTEISKWAKVVKDSGAKTY
jgi:tripartite-type tricarboxylate transporter receptor subunit TctC